ncbi:MAG: NUMOD4 domain-containing protein [Ferruginibacter sp.]
MVKDYPGEKWKAIKFDFEYINDLEMEVSNFGRIRSFGRLTHGNILKGSMINGYKIIRTKFFTKRDAKKQKELDNLKKQVLKLSKQIKLLKENKAGKTAIKEATEKLANLKESVSKKFKADEKNRTIYYHSLIHRLVATYFLRKPSASQTIVAHLDYNKLNNKVSNLKWMTADENYLHQQSSPYVIAEKKLRENKSGGHSITKLNVKKVMLLKKLLNQNKPVRQLAKKFKVTDTQIIRIRKGENWGGVKAAR